MHGIIEEKKGVVFMGEYSWVSEKSGKRKILLEFGDFNVKGKM